MQKIACKKSCVSVPLKCSIRVHDVRLRKNVYYINKWKLKRNITNALTFPSISDMKTKIFFFIFSRKYLAKSYKNIEYFHERIGISVEHDSKDGTAGAKEPGT